MSTILIVEDNEKNMKLVRDILQHQGHTTLEAVTGADGVRIARQSKPDLVLMDIQLPDIDGIAALREIRRERALDAIPVLAVSASVMPDEQQKMIRKAQHRDALLEGRRILVVEDDVRNVYALTNILEPRGAIVEIARNGQEALDALAKSAGKPGVSIDLVLMDVMMPVMDGLTATRAIRNNPAWKKLPVITLTAKAMPDDQQRCIDAGANDYMAKPLDVEKLLSLVRVWMPR